MNRVLSAAVVCCLVLLPATGRVAGRINYRMFMYKNGDGNVPGIRFSPHDKIVVHIEFVRLPRGEYTFQADWYNAFGELQDSSRHTFSLQEPSDYAVESWLKITRAGFLTRLFSASETTGYSVKFYGKWRVRLFLNGEEVAGRYFEVR